MGAAWKRPLRSTGSPAPDPSRMKTDLMREKQQTIRALEVLLQEIEITQGDIERIQAKLEGLIPMRVVWKTKCCGKNQCRCRRGMRHGPYPYLVEYKGGERIERYLGVGWSPPEGMVRPEQFRDLMGELRARQARLEELLERLDKAAKDLGSRAFDYPIGVRRR